MAEIDTVIDAHGGWPGAFAAKQTPPAETNAGLIILLPSLP